MSFLHITLRPINVEDYINGSLSLEVVDWNYHTRIEKVIVQL